MPINSKRRKACQSARVKPSRNKLVRLAISSDLKIDRAYSMLLVAAFRPASRTGIAQRVFNVGREKPANNNDTLRGFHPPYMAALRGLAYLTTGIYIVDISIR
jgi:hypothetical protein